MYMTIDIGLYEIRCKMTHMCVCYPVPHINVNFECGLFGEYLGQMAYGI